MNKIMKTIINQVKLITLLLMLSMQPSYAADTSAPLTPSLTESYQTDLMTGAAVINVPIAASPGRAGIQPSLALSYSSNNPNGIYGVGWQMNLGTISRNTKNGVPKYDSTDSFVANLNGATAELVDIGSGEYRAKQEGAFLKFSFDGTFWQVKDKSGTTYFFGQATSSRQENSGNVFKWYLDKVLDLHGNYMAISYVADQGQVYISQIQYTGNETLGDIPTNSVDFIYEARNDILSSYRSGYEIITAKRLSTIDIFANGQRSRKYILNYIYSADTARSILNSITQYGDDGVTALNPITFSYQSGGIIGP